MDINKAKEKIKSYCAYQDRSPHEVIIKLKKLGQNSRSIDIIVDELIRLNFLNEKRYAISFCRGKFRIKKWGRKKIYLELKKREINPKYIQIALAEIDDLEYRQTIAGKDHHFNSQKENFPLSSWGLPFCSKTVDLWPFVKDQEKIINDDIIFGKAIIDKSSLDIISGSVVDFKKEMIGESFVIDNPQATASCGCGLSFSV